MNNVYVRLVLYVLSYLVALLPVWAVGMIELQTLANGTHALVINIEAVVGAVVAAIAANVGIFKKWGTK